MAERKWVCNASPIILLAKTDRADLLPALSDELVIPEPVEREVHSGPEGSPARHWLRTHRSQYEQPSVSVVPEVASWDLGNGESAVLSWAARDVGWTVIVDDLAGRRCGQALGLPVTGTLGVLLLAKEEGRISKVKPMVDALVNAGLQVSDALLKEVLRKADEAR